MKNKTAPPGFTRFFSFCGAPTYRSRLRKTKRWPQCPPQAKKNWDLGCVLYKKHKPPRGVSARRRLKFFGHLGALYTKITLLGCIQERVSGAKHPPNPKKNRLRRFYRTIYTCFSTLCGAVRRPEKKYTFYHHLPLFSFIFIAIWISKSIYFPVKKSIILYS